MKQKLAVIVVHGLGRQNEDYADHFIRTLMTKFAHETGAKDPEQNVVVKAVHWAKVLEGREAEFKQKLFRPYDLHYEWLRDYVVHYLADAIAYQPLETNDQNYYAINETISASLHALTDKAGDGAPLWVISHSLGTVIASNYFYDLQNSSNWKPVIYNPDSALERGDTLALFYSCGTTLPLWSLRYREFDKPIRVPSESMRDRNIEGEWINFYDKDDILAYPLRPLHPAYMEAVQEDMEVRVGNWLTGWNPFSLQSAMSSIISSTTVKM
ncbi:chemotaxis protein [Paenibacillus sp. sptzw28]|uniref:chemotaxis protein n=1 Tax=Paenibacillus sp. sptzw28 TaxID=715179 RepID=UPI001C6F5373|nr:chemotaxis protein [Paenibacillus sp. sptzw28]QYR22502.1 chemotaxis protein [Paenibacillus sp. sptzw28]